eukprot:4236859-Pyramimonas_sp.AAC.1
MHQQETRSEQFKCTVLDPAATPCALGPPRSRNLSHTKHHISGFGISWNRELSNTSARLAVRPSEMWRAVNTILN